MNVTTRFVKRARARSALCAGLLSAIVLGAPGAALAQQQILLDKPGLVTLGCNIHDWMIAYIFVVPTPWFGRTDASGAARLRDLPAGSYEVRAVHPNQRTGAPPQALVLDAATAASASFVVDPAPRKARYKPPLDRARY